MPPQIVTTQDEPLDIACDALLVSATEGTDGAELSSTAASADDRLEGMLAEALRSSGFKGKEGTTAVVTTLGKLPAGALVVVGLGPMGKTSPAGVRRTAALVARGVAARSEVVSAVHIGLDDDQQQASVEGFLLGSYRFARYTSDDTPTDVRTQRIVIAQGDETLVARGEAFGEATNACRDLVNETPDRLTPAEFADRAKQMADLAGLDCTVLDGEALEQRGFGGLVAVGKGSAEPPRLVDLTYSPTGATTRVTLVGKGITYDSGGLSIKPAASMTMMKTDMAGGAAALAAICALAKMGTKVGVRVIIPMAENMPSGTAFRPDDVITHYGGRTTEVTNTDAEGRLILADALALASEDPPDAIVDVATLTGHIVIGLGTDVAGLFSNDDSLSDALRSAAVIEGEELWPMPLYKGYVKQLRSDVADGTNRGKREGGAVSAALFLERFVAAGIPWAHLDIAGPADTDTPHDLGPRGGTGFATRTLIRWVERLADQ